MSLCLPAVNGLDVHLLDRVLVVGHQVLSLELEGRGHQAVVNVPTIPDQVDGSGHRITGEAACLPLYSGQRFSLCRCMLQTGSVIRVQSNTPGKHFPFHLTNNRNAGDERTILANHKHLLKQGIDEDGLLHIIGRHFLTR